MVTEVSPGKVGVVAAREVPRFARDSRERQQLVEVCRVVDLLSTRSAFVDSLRATIELTGRQVVDRRDFDR